MHSTTFFSTHNMSLSLETFLNIRTDNTFELEILSFLLLFRQNTDLCKITCMQREAHSFLVVEHGTHTLVLKCTVCSFRQLHNLGVKIQSCNAHTHSLKKRNDFGYKFECNIQVLYTRTVTKRSSLSSFGQAQAAHSASLDAKTEAS